MTIRPTLAAILLTLAVFLPSCSPSTPGPSAFTEIDQQGVYALIHGKNQIEGQYYEDLTRLDYAVPTTQWVFDVYAPQLEAFLAAHNELAYTPELNDCVKFAAHGVSMAFTAYDQDAGHLDKTSLAVWTFTFVPITTPQENVAHVVVMFVVNDQDGIGPKLLFFSPQTRLEYPMTWEEALSCQNWRM